MELARTKGVIGVNPAKGTDSVKYVLEETYSHGADAVLITASAKTDEVIHQAAEMSRKRGRIVLVGVIGLDIRRDDFIKRSYHSKFLVPMVRDVMMKITKIKE